LYYTEQLPNLLSHQIAIITPAFATNSVAAMLEITQTKIIAV